jgi:hypothetical protein
MSEQSNYDMPVMVGALVVGLIAVGIFWFTKPDPVQPPPPAEPVTTPINPQAIPTVMIDTDGKSDSQQGGLQGPAPAAGAGGGGGGPMRAGATSAG